MAFKQANFYKIQDKVIFKQAIILIKDTTATFKQSMFNHKSTTTFKQAMFVQINKTIFKQAMLVHINKTILKQAMFVHFNSPIKGNDQINKTIHIKQPLQ